MPLKVHLHDLFECYFWFYFGFSINEFVNRLLRNALWMFCAPYNLDAGSEVGVDCDTGDIERELEDEKTLFPLIHEIKYKLIS